MTLNPRVHLPLMAAVAAVLGVCFLQEPLLGDDLTYWSFARDLHERGAIAWQRQSFYDLRWPVWSVCWLMQAIVGANLLSYWSVPVLYLGAGATLTFCFGKQLTNSIGAAWACGLAFVFHPFFDSVSYAPMPDLSESVWGAAAMLAWWKLMSAEGSARSWLFAGAAGFCVFVLEANRITGVLVVSVLVVCTACFFKGRFHWLVAAGLVALGLYAIECCFYHHLFGHWLHDLSANGENKGAQGTEFANPWMLPFRFAGSFSQEPLARLYTLAALAGISFALRKGNLVARVLVLWFAVLLFEYSCAPQSLSPVWPLVRNATRFLSCVAAPMSLLAAYGFNNLRRLVRPAWQHPLASFTAIVITIAALTAATKRNFFDPGFVPELRRYLATVPDGSSIFTHASMREVVELVDPRAAKRLRWVTHSDILQYDPALEAEAKACDEFWYERTLAWLVTRQQLNRNRSGPEPMLASYFSASEDQWTLTESLMKGGSPDLVFYRKRAAGHASQIYDGNRPTLPFVWERNLSEGKTKTIWTIPDQFRGRLVRLELDAASEQNEAFVVRLGFIEGRRKQKEPFVLRPYLFPGGGMDFFTLRIPAASTACEIQLRFGEKTKRVEFNRFRAVLEKETAR